jgi:FixJ family two-component response regulator
MLITGIKYMKVTVAGGLIGVVKHSSGWSLTAREKEVLLAVTKGLVKKEIAGCLGISKYTMEDYQRRLPAIRTEKKFT